MTGVGGAGGRGERATVPRRFCCRVCARMHVAGQQQSLSAAAMRCSCSCSGGLACPGSGRRRWLAWRTGLSPSSQLWRDSTRGAAWAFTHTRETAATADGMRSSETKARVQRETTTARTPVQQAAQTPTVPCARRLETASHGRRSRNLLRCKHRPADTPLVATRVPVSLRQHSGTTTCMHAARMQRATKAACHKGAAWLCLPVSRTATPDNRLAAGCGARQRSHPHGLRVTAPAATATTQARSRSAVPWLPLAHKPHSPVRAGGRHTTRPHPTGTVHLVPPRCCRAR